MGADGEPEWPPGFVGTITHAHGYASAAVARSLQARGIGVDFERVMHDERAVEVASTVASETEMAALERASGWGRAEILTLVFSAKESIFKCLYPEVRRHFDYHEAAITVVEPARGRFFARLLVSLTDALPKGLLLEGRFERVGGSICTGLLLSV
jgi:4'-phosphopantetheinyl transferase EntD